MSDEDDEITTSFVAMDARIDLVARDSSPVLVDPEDEDLVAYQTSNDLETELAEFRRNWKSELERVSAGSTEQVTNVSPRTTVTVDKVHKSIGNLQDEQPSDLIYQQPENSEEKAQYLFNKGVMLEQQSRYHEAIQFYKLALQLDENVEAKLFALRETSVAKVTSSDSTGDLATKLHQVDINATHTKPPTSLYQEFQAQLVIDDNRFCTKQFPQKATHFSELPVEVILNILRWVVSDHLDMRSLEQFAKVCKGFYICARDPEIWRIACAKTWRDSLNVDSYLNWRDMFLKRPRLNFDGVYISKTSYARPGEYSLDNCYSPWHLVEYYRYFRFFSNGTVLFLTTPDEPKVTVSKLRPVTASTATPLGLTQPSLFDTHTNTLSILKGSWRLTKNTVSMVFHRTKTRQANHKYSRRLAKDLNAIEQENIFSMELDLSSSQNKTNNLLLWNNYEIENINKLTNSRNLTKFDLNRIDFPNFYFSRVRSYTASAEVPLKF